MMFVPFRILMVVLLLAAVIALQVFCPAAKHGGRDWSFPR